MGGDFTTTVKRSRKRSRGHCRMDGRWQARETPSRPRTSSVRAGQYEKCSGVELRLHPTPQDRRRGAWGDGGRQGRALQVRAGNPNKDNDYLIDRAAQKGEDS